jgi:hypothetical protein
MMMMTMTVTVMMTMFPLVMFFQYLALYMSEMMTRNFRYKLDFGHNLFSYLLNKTFWHREVTMVLMMSMMMMMMSMVWMVSKRHIQLASNPVEIRYSMKALNNRKGAFDYLWCDWAI